jgi:hypothetical protein
MTTTSEGFVVETCQNETCLAPIVWARRHSGGGGVAAVDAEPSPDGNVRLFETQGIVWARMVSDDEAVRMRRDPLAVPLRTLHSLTCQRAADWRKPR